MTTSTLAREIAKEVTVGMGQISGGKSPQRMKAVLGSCIGLVLYHPRLKTGVMAHVVLPESAGRADSAGKFADTAIPEMLKKLKQLGAPCHGLTAKFAGGANMFGSSGPLQIGDANAKAVLQAVRDTGARVMSQDCGGNKGRRVIFDCSDGTMTIECAGQPARVI
jgi:chemotaxis protein CheD